MPGRTTSTISSRMEAASAPDLRMASKSAGPCSVIRRPSVMTSSSSSSPYIAHFCQIMRGLASQGWQGYMGCMSTLVTAALVVIGNEILSGRTQDKNIAHVATRLNEAGIQLREVRVVPDLEPEIVGAVNAVRARY